MTDEIDISTLTDAQLAQAIGDDAVPEAVPEAAPEAAPAPEPVAEQAEPEESEGHPKRRMLDDLREERARRKEMAARMEEMEKRFAEYQARTAEYLQTLQTPGAAPTPPPDFEADPIEFLRHQQAEVSKSLEALKAQQAAIEQRRQAEGQWAAMREAVGRAEAEFVKSKPDYYDAVNHLRSGRRTALEAQGASPSQIDQVLQADAVAVATEAGRLGLSPAEYAYRIALGYGWQPRPVAAVKSAAEAPKSLAGAAGRSDDATPSLQDIAKMSDDAFNKLFDKLMTGT